MKKNLLIGMFTFLVFALGAAWAQNLGQISGKILGEDGKPLVNAKVLYSDPNSGRKYNFKTNKKGEFAGLGIPFGSYQVTIKNEKGEEVMNVTLTVGIDPDDNDLQVDLSKPPDQQRTHISHSGATAQGGRSVGGHYSAPSTAQDQNQGQGKSQNQGQGQISAGGQGQKASKEQVEEIKKQNEKAQGTNALAKQVNEAMGAKNYEAAVAPLQQLIAADPNNWQYYSALGDAQLNLGQYDQAVETYGKGIQVAESNTTVDPKNPSTDPAKKKTGEAQMLTNQGNAYLKLKKNKEAVDDYTKAAGMDPNPSVAYFNLCATQYNTGNVEGALAACDKAIAADPNRADAYFIKGSLLVGSSTMDKDGKMQAPPGTAETLNKYLEVAPDGPHAKDVKDMLAAIGSKVETTYKKRGK